MGSYHNHNGVVSKYNEIHENEWVYSTFLSRMMNLHQVNYSIHHLPKVPHFVEFPIFLCGYAFNPIMIPFWMAFVYQLSSSSSSSSSSPSDSSIGNDNYTTTIRFPLLSASLEKQPLKYMLFYIATVVLVLIFTEISKASFATTRPEKLLAATAAEQQAQEVIVRRYGSLVSSLKSKHSFPSGDCAQAMNICLFLYKYVPAPQLSSSISTTLAIRDVFFFGVFLPGVCYARVFYKCHWIEDCLGGILLSSMIHWLVLDHFQNAIFQFFEKIFLWLL